MYEIKLDGYRAQAIKTLGKLQLRHATITTSASVIAPLRTPLANCRTKLSLTVRLLLSIKLENLRLMPSRIISRRNPTFTSTFSICSSCRDEMSCLNL